MRKIVSLGKHLGAHENVDVSVAYALAHACPRLFAACAVAIYAE
jgi:hypothetical protein